MNRSRWRWLAAGTASLVLLAGLVVLACRRGGEVAAPSSTPDEAPAADDLFRDVTAGSGIDFVYHNGQEANHYAILESLGGGVALLDYDGDGLLDVFVTGGGTFGGPDKKQILPGPCRLYRNRGNWKFQDVTAAAGLDHVPFYSHGAAVADYDRDGWPDLLVTGYGGMALYHNEPDGKGGRHFVEVTRRAGLHRDHFWATSAGWADLDGDGFPDLYVCQYVDWSFANNPVCSGYSADVERDICPPAQFNALPHALYRNNGDGTFTDVSKSAGLRGPRTDKDYAELTWLGKESRERLEQADHDRDYGKGLGVVIADLDGDGRPDVYVANDTTDKLLYMNRSERGHIRLEELGVPWGAARDDRGAPNGSMGVDAGDYDGSGRPGLLVTNYENELHALYQNLPVRGGLFFSFSSRTTGIASIGRHYVGFGTGFLDVDNDGWLDVVIVNGHVIRYPKGSGVRQLAVLLHNEGRPEGRQTVRFTSLTSRGGSYFRAPHQARGLAIGDLDNDGRPDLVISHLNGPVVLLRNEAGAGNHWLGIELAGEKNADVVGVRLTLAVGGRTLTRIAKGGGSYLSSGDRRHLFGLGTESRAGRLTVRWPSGREQHWDDLAVDRYWLLKEGDPVPRVPAGQAPAGASRP